MANSPVKLKDQLNVVALSAAPGSPSAFDIYLDDGSNTASGVVGWRQWDGAAWQDIGATGGGGASPWSKTVAVVHPATLTDTVAINSSVMAGTEKLLVFDDRETGTSTTVEAFFNKDDTSDKTTWTGILSKVDHDGSGDATGYYANFASEATVNHASATLPLHIGFVNTTELLDGEISDARGFQTQANIAATMVMAAYTGFKAETNASAGEITTATGVQVEDQGQGSTTVYGVRIEGQTATTAYGLYQAGSGDLNRFEGQIGMGADPAASTAIDISSTTRALRISQMDTTARNALTAATGMMLFNTTDTAFQGYDGTSWATMASYWSRPGTYLTPATAGDRLLIGSGTLPSTTMMEIDYIGDEVLSPRTGLNVQCNNTLADGSSLGRNPLRVEINSDFNSAGYNAVWCDFNASTHFSDTSFFYSDAAYTGTSAVQTGNLYHFHAETINTNTSGKINRIYGFYLGGAGTGTSNYVYGMYVEGAYTGRAYGLYVAPQPNVTTAAYGVYVAPLSASGTGYGLYQAGANDLNYLNARTGIGVIPTASSARLHVQDNEEALLTEACLVELNKNSSTGNKLGWTGVRSYANHDGNVASTGTYDCFVAHVRYDASGRTLAAANGFTSRVNPNDSGDVITEWRAFNAETPTGNGDITTSYGLYVEDQGTGTDTAYGIYVAAQTGANQIGLYVDDDVRITGKLTVDGLIDPTGLKCAAQAADPGATGAAEGTFWIQTGTPTTAWFTDSAGTDHQLAAGGGSSPWTRDGANGLIYPTTTTDTAVVGTTNMLGNERLLVEVDDGDILDTGLAVNFTKNGNTGTTAWTGINVSVAYTGPQDSTSLICYDATPVINTTAGQTFTSITGYKTTFEFADLETFTNVRCFHAAVEEVDGDIENWYGLLVDDPSPVDDINNAYGVYIESMSGTTLSYGVYQAGATDINAFNGLVAVGTTTMSASEQLRVSGDVLIDGSGHLGIGVAPSVARHIDTLDTTDTTAIDAVRVRLTKTGAGAGKFFRGYISDVSHTGTGASTNYTGYRSSLTMNNASGSVSIGIGFDAAVDASNGTITAYRAFNANGTDSGGAITDAYGVYIDSMAGTSNSYGIYQADSGDLNYFAGRCGIGIAPAGDVVLKIDDTEDSGTDYGVQVNLSKTGISAKTHYGFYHDIDQLGSGTGTYASFFGDLAVTVSSSIASYVGADIGVLLNHGTAAITSATGFRFRATDSAGALGTVYGLNVAVPSGTCTNGYGVYIGAMNGTTNSWGIYQTDEDDDNYFAGNVGVGAVPGTYAALEVTSTTGAFIVPRMTTAERSAMTGRNGMIVYDTTVGAFLFHEGGSWVTGSGLT